MIALPPTAARLADLIGSEATLTLLNHARRADGRCYVYVPLRPRPGKQLVDLIGMAAAVTLAKEYGGHDIQLPKCAAIDRAHRDVEIKRMAEEGATRASIARRFGISARHVGNLLAV